MEKYKRYEQSDDTKRKNMENHLANLRILHGMFYKGTYYHHGVGQKHSKHEDKRSDKKYS